MSRVRGVIHALAAITLLVSFPSLAHAAHVTSSQPWAASNEYLVEANVDGRTRPQSEPRAKIDWRKAGQWAMIQCQVEGELADGSRIWDLVGGYFVLTISSRHTPTDSSVALRVAGCRPRRPPPSRRPGARCRPAAT